MRVFQASRLRDADKIHTCNFNQPDPLDAALGSVSDAALPAPFSRAVCFFK